MRAATLALIKFPTTSMFALDLSKATHRLALDSKGTDVDVGEFQLPKLGTIRWQGHTETASRIEPVSLGRTGTHKTNFIVGRGSQAFVDRLPPGTYRLDGPVNRVTVTQEQRRPSRPSFPTTGSSPCFESTIR